MMTIQAINISLRRKNRLPAPVGVVWSYVGIWRNRMRQRHDLRELDTRQLRDIGLSRSDAEIECNKPFWRA